MGRGAGLEQGLPCNRSAGCDVHGMVIEVAAPAITQAACNGTGSVCDKASEFRFHPGVVVWRSSHGIEGLALEVAEV